MLKLLAHNIAFANKKDQELKVILAHNSKRRLPCWTF